MNDSINCIDSDGHAWYHLAIGARIIVGCAALSAIFAGGTIRAAAIGVACTVTGGKIDENGFSLDNGWSWENSSKGFIIGSIAGAVIGGAWGEYTMHHKVLEKWRLELILII